MSRERPTNLAASVADRLLQRTRKTGEDHQLLLTRYGLERLMYRLSRSEAADRFVVKGALVFLVWRDEPFRMTRDLDLMATLKPSAEQLLRLFRSLCRLKVEEDGVEFDEASIAVAEIREDQQYGGLRVTMRGRLGNIRIPIQVDIGFGDAMTPEPKVGPFPVLLDFPAPVLRLYSKETVVAEKAEAMVQLGLVNSRMKDYFDLWILLREFEFDGELLKMAIHATFNRRKTPIPSDVPEGLSDQFTEDRHKQSQWTAFLRRTHARKPDDIVFKTVVEGIRVFLVPPMLAAGKSESFSRKWPKGGPWQV
jgi:predicted nucleotidyltransferase component of viral defense system